MIPPSRYLSLLLVVGGFASSLFAQGLNTQARPDDWEEINFEFNYSVLTDGYPSLLRLGELLRAHPDYRVNVEGHTDAVGSNAYNDKLAQARANTVRDFLVKYGANANQLTTSGQGKRNPKVDNTTPPGRFMNRRVVLTVRDGQSRVISDGGVGDAIRAVTSQAPQPAQPNCCDEITKRLGRLDEIIALLQDLKKENAALQKEIADLRMAQAGLQKEVDTLNTAPKPPDKDAITDVVRAEATKAVAAGKDPRFALLGLNAGPDTTGNVTFTGRGRFFAPFGNAHAVQAEGEYLHYRDRQEGQFDLGLVNRYHNVQAGLFSSFRYADLRDYQRGGLLGQGSLTVDYLFKRGRIGVFGTKAFRDNVVIGSKVISTNIFEESYLKVVDQIGGSTQIGLYGDSYVEGNLGALFRHGGSNRPGGTVRFVQPINHFWAFTIEAGLNETLVSSNDHGRVVFGLQLGNWVRPKTFTELKHPVPVDIPRLRYEVLTRRVRTGNSPPVADAGPDQLGAAPGPIVLDGSASYDPDGDPMTFQWTQISGPDAQATGLSTNRATFTAAANTNYQFRLAVRDDHGGQGVARVTVDTSRSQVRIARFTAVPDRIKAGDASTLTWNVDNATDVEISGVGKVDPRSGTTSVRPNQTTTYTLTARNGTTSINESVTVVVDRPEARILKFTATPVTIRAGEASTLAWETENADTVTLSGASVARSGTSSVSPTQTTTYTLTARNSFGEVSSTATVTVAPAQAPRIIRFAATPPEILPSEQTALVWQVENATEVNISGIGKVDLSGTSTVNPTDTITYTLTARNAQGEVTATAVVSVLKPVKILNFVADPPSSPSSGAPVTLRWTTTDATDVVITGVGSVPVNGTVIVNPTVDTSYSLVAYGKRSQATALVIIRVGLGTSGGGGNPPPPGGNRPPVANAGADFNTIAFITPLDGSASFDPDGDPITYSWRSLGPLNTEIYGASSVRPQVRFTGGFGSYTFELTVTDSHGAKSTDTVTVGFLYSH
jgi:hypothetical protein